MTRTPLPLLAATSIATLRDTSKFRHQWQRTGLSTTYLAVRRRMSNGKRHHRFPLRFQSRLRWPRPDTVPNRTVAPFNTSRLDHSCSCIVWCSNAKDCKTVDFPEALKPVNNVNGASGNNKCSKHLKERRSTLVSIEYTLDHGFSHFETL